VPLLASSRSSYPGVFESHFPRFAGERARLSQLLGQRAVRELWEERTMTAIGLLRAALVACGLVLFVIVQAACTGLGTDKFVSDNPNVGAGGPFPGGGPMPPVGGVGGAGGTGSGGAGGSGGSAPPPPGGDPGRAIAEADIVQVVGDRLYALSRYGGLNIVDIARPNDLRLLGRYRTEATPFEMYVHGGTVLGLFTNWNNRVESSGSWQWVQTSQILVLDTMNPASVQQRAAFEVPGEISDSRVVGNILYVVSYQNAGCYHCGQAPRTVVTSLDVSNPASVRKVDELVFNDVQDQWGWGKRSITVTTERMYVAGRVYSSTGELGSEIQVVDITDPRGDLVLGATVRADGQITSRWQMDEYQGVLRVISQPWQWMLSTTVPTVQTFQVRSATELVPLGELSLVLPRPEQLQSTRFDGPRAYAITAERTDPLFTIDLSDPAAPRQAGELEMPGFIYHMEPRGDRLIGLGFDQQNAQGALHVNLFDVSDLDAPRLIRRVNFGGTWAHLPEDQDRIQKAFKVLDAAGLILVPFSGYVNATSFCSNYTSGIQLVDFTRDSLTLRGMAPAWGAARRALIHREALLAVSDERVQAFDISNRSAPSLLDSQALAIHVQRSAGVQNSIVRLGLDWWNTHTAALDVTPLSQPDLPQGVGSLDIPSALESSCGSYVGSGRVFGHGSRAYLLYEDYDNLDGSRASAAAVVDVTNPAAPRLEANAVLAEFGANVNGPGYVSANIVAAGDSVVQIGSTFVTARTSIEYDPMFGGLPPKAWLEVADAAAPSRLRATKLDLPVGTGINGLHTDGSIVLTSHYEESATEPGKVRFYLDRIDVANPAAPRYLGKVNVPGSLLAWDAASRRAITVDYRRTVQNDVGYDDCFMRGGYGYVPGIDTSVGTCTLTQQVLRQVRVDETSAVLEGSWDVPAGLNVSRAAAGSDRVFIGLTRRYYYYYYPMPPGGCSAPGCGPTPPPASLVVLSGLASGELHAATLPIANELSYGQINHLLAFGQRALVGSMYYADDLTVIDATNAAAPSVQRKVNVVGQLSDMQKYGNLALLSLGSDGAQVIDMSQ
jgi:hypothetical protein